MKFSDFAIIAATLLGPVLAVQAQKWLERLRDKEKRKEFIFRTLMATRAARVSPEHVQALNMIDFEFYGGADKEKAVRAAWNEYRDHLNTPFTSETYAVWEARGNEFFVDLLYQMSVCVGYEFDKPHIRKSAYSPVAHGNLEKDQNLIRAGLVALLTNKYALPTMNIPATKEVAESQDELQKLLIQNLRGERPYKVEIVNPDGSTQTNRGIEPA